MTLEVAYVDHTGIDVIATLSDGKRIGISVKSRTRTAGKETDTVNLLTGSGKDRQKLEAACTAFGVEPWLAVYVECGTSADLYLTSLENYDREHRTSTSRVIDDWKMTASAKQAYQRDPKVMHISFSITVGNWWHRGLATAGS